MSKIALDLKDFKHVSSDDKSTTLQHRHGHQIRLAHNVLSKDAKAQLEALSKAPKEDDEHPYGKVIRKADGGGVDAPGTVGSSKEYNDKVKGLSQGSSSASPKEHKKTEDFNITGGYHVHYDADHPENSYSKGGKVKESFLDKEHEEEMAKKRSENKKRHDDFMKNHEEIMKKPVKLAEGGEYNLPCLNPNCKSHGKPHPNCRCYSRLASGGEVEHFCDSHMKHDKECEYHKDIDVKRYAEGDEVSQDNTARAVPGTPININVNGGGSPQQPEQGSYQQALQTYKNALMHVVKAAPGAAEALQKFLTPAGAAKDIQQPDQVSSAPTLAPQSPAPAQNQPESALQPEDKEEAPQMPLDQDKQVENEIQQTQAPEAPQRGSYPNELPPNPQFVNPPEPAQDYLQASQAWQNDLNNGHITPETYESMFAKKSTLGKIGTLFGLLVGGAAAGITHQPNAVLEMMNKEIANDLEAQKQSKVNALNLNHLAEEHFRDEVQAGHIALNDKMVQAQYKQMFATRAAFHKQLMDVQKMPEGTPAQKAMKQQAFQALGMISQALDKQDMNAADAINARMRFLQGTVGGSAGAGEQAYQAKQQALRLSGRPDLVKLADDNDARHFPGLPGQASVPLSPADTEGLRNSMEFDTKLHRFMDWAKTHSGDLKPKDVLAGRAMAAELQGAYRMATHGGVYKEGEQNFISKLIDSEPTKFFNEIRVLPQLNAIAHETNSRINQRVKSYGFPGYPGAKPEQMPASKAEAPTIERFDPKSGKTVIFDAKTKRPLRFK